MTYKEENIINIAMRAGEFLEAGEIARDDVSGHVGLCEAIVQMAEDFEKKFEGVDWNAGPFDYWEEIDLFAEEQLIEKFGVKLEREDPEVAEPLQIKVIVEDGIVQEVLKDNNVPVHVEVVDVDLDYDYDWTAFRDYRDALCKDPNFMKCDYGVADITVKYPPVVERAQGDREDDSLPEGYYEALDWYCERVGDDIESELVRRYAEELVDCYQHERDITDFISWAMYEALLDEKISYEECVALDRACDEVGSGTDIEPTGMQEALRVVLARVRESEQIGKVQAEQAPALDLVISFPVTVFGESAGGARIDIFHGDFDACLEFCKARNWEFKDGNGFVWDLEMEDSRDFPEGYFTAVEHYANLMGCDIENEYMRQHAEELTTCYQKDLDFSDYAHWCGYETLLGEKITFAEFRDLDDYFLLDPDDIDKEDRDTISRIKFVLGAARDKNEKLAAEGWLLDAKIQEAEGLKSGGAGRFGLVTPDGLAR